MYYKMPRSVLFTKNELCFQYEGFELEGKTRQTPNLGTAMEIQGPQWK